MSYSIDVLHCYENRDANIPNVKEIFGRYLVGIVIKNGGGVLG